MFDLHVHSSYSDGTVAPARLANAVAERGLSGFALTDHDTIAGISEAGTAAHSLGIDLVPGVELSAVHGDNIIHVLGYDIDPTSPALLRQFERLHELRLARAQTIVEHLSRDFPIEWASVLEFAGDPRTIGRPHIADALVSANIVHDRRAAFDTLLHETSPYVVRLDAPSATSAISAIVDAGGSPVIAHLRGDLRISTSVDEEVVRSWVDAGLRGLEVDHREHSPSARRELSALAARLSLLQTGGSDYHGSRKPNVLGENLTAPAVVESLRTRRGVK